MLFATGAVSTSRNFGEGFGPDVFYATYCIGNESRLIDCRHDARVNSCSRSDAGVKCQARTGQNLNVIQLAFLNCFASRHETHNSLSQSCPYNLLITGENTQ